MSHSNTIFNQLLQLLPRHEFDRAVSLHNEKLAKKLEKIGVRS